MTAPSSLFGGSRSSENSSWNETVNSPGILLEEQRLACDRRHHRGLEWLRNQEGWLRSISGQKALRIGRNEYDRNFERTQYLVNSVHAGAAICKLDIGEN